jgi:hypothetical protein
MPTVHDIALSFARGLRPSNRVDGRRAAGERRPVPTDLEIVRISSLIRPPAYHQGRTIESPQPSEAHRA